MKADDPGCVKKAKKFRDALDTIHDRKRDPILSPCDVDTRQLCGLLDRALKAEGLITEMQDECDRRVKVVEARNEQLDEESKALAMVVNHAVNTRDEALATVAHLIVVCEEERDHWNDPKATDGPMQPIPSEETRKRLKKQAESFATYVRRSYPVKVVRGKVEHDKDSGAHLVLDMESRLACGITLTATPF